MTELSPAAEAVFRAATNADGWSEEGIAAATLRAMTDWFHSFDTAKDCYKKMHAVADELEKLTDRKCNEKQRELCDLHAPGPK